VALNTQLVTGFANPLVTTTDLFTIEPAPVTQDSWFGGDRLTLALELAPGQRYTVTRAAVTDLFGNTAPAEVIKLHAEDLPPALEQPQVPVAVERGSAKLPLRVLNVGAIEATVTRFESIDQWVAWQQKSGCAGSPIATSHARSKAALNEHDLVDLPLQRVAGLLCVSVTAEGKGSHKEGLQADARVLVSDLAATVKTEPGGLFVWATRLSTAAPVAGAKIELHDGAERCWRARPPMPTAWRGSRARGASITVHHKGDLGLTDLDDASLSRPSQFGMPGPGAQPRLDAALFTERGVYRPGEAVHVKAIAKGSPLTLRGDGSARAEGARAGAQA